MRMNPQIWTIQDWTQLVSTVIGLVSLMVAIAAFRHQRRMDSRPPPSPPSPLADMQRAEPQAIPAREPQPTVGVLRAATSVMLSIMVIGAGVRRLRRTDRQSGTTGVAQHAVWPEPAPASPIEPPDAAQQNSPFLRPLLAAVGQPAPQGELAGWGCVLGGGLLLVLGVIDCRRHRLAGRLDRGRRKRHRQTCEHDRHGRP
jgi:hypothetical protein